MVATQSFSVSRRTLDVEDYIDIIRRHVGWIVGPAFLGLVAAICVAFTMPNEYTSTATMRITPGAISDVMVQNTSSNSLQQRITQMQTEITSRGQLSNIIQNPRLDLYKKERLTRPLEDVIEDMKRAISIQFVTLPGALGQRASAFNITFSYKDRYKAKQVVDELVSKFDEENQNSQKSDQAQLNGLVGDMLGTAKATLNEAQDKLTAFKVANAGKLPENVQLNIARENGYSEKLKTASDQIYRDTQQLTQLEQAKDAQKARLDFFDLEQSQMESLMAPGSVAAQQNQDLLALDKTIDNLEFNLQDLTKRFKPDYPETKKARTLLESYKTRRDDLAKKIAAKAEADAKAASDPTKPKDVQKSLSAMKQQEVRYDVAEKIKVIDTQEKLINDNIAKTKLEQETYKKESDATERMLKDSTGLEAQYEDLNQAKRLAEANYQDLEHKQQIASANGQLIDRKAGEVLDVLDTATLPAVPTKPDRTMIIGAGFAMSLILGLGMAGLQEARDTSLKNLKDVRAYTNLPVLCSVPLLENTMLVKRKRRLTYLAWTAAVLVGAVAVTASVVYYYTITMHS